MRLEVPEAAGEREVLLGGDALVAEEDDLVLAATRAGPRRWSRRRGRGPGRRRDLGADGRTERLHAEMVIGLLLSVGVDGSQRARSDVKLRHRSSPSCPLLTRCPCEVNATRGHAKNLPTPRAARILSLSAEFARRALVMAVGFLVALAARPALSDVDVRFERLDGFAAPGTPANLDQVGVLKIGSKRARNVLVLNPGTSAGSAYFLPFAQDIVATREGWQVWSVERRENQLEDQSVLDLAKQGTATSNSCSTTTSVGSPTRRHQPLPADPRRRRLLRSRLGHERRDRGPPPRRRGRAREGRKVVLGGHSLGGSITTAYATWDFNGVPGADGPRGSRVHRRREQPDPGQPAQATASLQSLQSGTPWLAFGGIPAPFLGLFSATGSPRRTVDPDSASLGQPFAARFPPISSRRSQRRTRRSSATRSTPHVTAQPPCGAGARRPARRDRQPTRVGPGRGDLTDPAVRGDVVGHRPPRHRRQAWYHPQRLTIDAGAVADGNATPLRPSSV